MNPQSPNTPNAMLPQPSVAQYPQAMPVAAAPSQQATPPQYAMANPATQASAPAMPMPPATPVAAAPVAALAPESDEAGDDIWVNKAREIIRGLQADPFAESIELGKLKAAYLKVRYGKEIKTGGDGQQ